MFTGRVIRQTNRLYVQRMTVNWLTLPHVINIRKLINKDTNVNKNVTKQ